MMHPLRSVVRPLAAGTLFVLCAALAIGTVGAQHSHHKDQPYRGQQARSVAGLSASDVQQIEAGNGWGLALAAELNGYPGPRHVLDLANELELTDQQAGQTRDVFAKMQTEAIRIGTEFIAAERALSKAFRSRDVDASGLEALLKEAELQRRQLRFTHLAAHLEMARILTADQINRYDVLRGYADDPCRTVPEGHDAVMWRKHNGCEPAPESPANDDARGPGKPLETLEDYRAKGSALAMRTKATLGRNLVRALQDSGAPGAVRFCKTEAANITENATSQVEASVVRVSDRPRNLENAADAMELATIETFRAQLARGESLQPVMRDAGDSIVGYYPIITNGMCLQCHGAKGADIKPETQAAIDAAYPGDRASGYAANQVRGIFVVTMSKRRGD